MEGEGRLVVVVVVVNDNVWVCVGICVWVRVICLVLFIWLMEWGVRLILVF